MAEPWPSTHDPWHQTAWQDPHKADFRILVLGTSISWGQGLLPEEKYAHLIAREIAVAGKCQRPAIVSYARSGARIWSEPNNGLERQRLRDCAPTELDHVIQLRETGDYLPGVPNRHNGECPGQQPYIWRQLLDAKEDFERAGVKADLVLVDTGANDVGIMGTLNPLVEARNLVLRITQLKGSIYPLLDDIRTAPPFKDAPILHFGYYQAVSEHSDLAHAGPGNGPVPCDWFLFDAIQKSHFDNELFQASVAKSALFRRIFNEDLLPEEVSIFERLHNNPRIHLCLPVFKPEHALLALSGQSRIWGPDRNGAPIDSVIDSRTGQHGSCRSHPLHTKAVHHRASFGHPNVEGAKSYAASARAALRKEGLLPQAAPVPVAPAGGGVLVP